MSGPLRKSADQVAGLLRRCLEEGRTVEIDGIGLFRPDGHGRFVFEPNTRPSVFIAYVEEDREHAERLHGCLDGHGFRPWLDKRKLLAGQNWPRAIEGAIEVSDFFMPLFSHRSVAKKGTFQSELRHALECASRLPLDDTYVMPVRLDDCQPPKRIREHFQYVDLFPDWDKGLKRIVAAIEREHAQSRRRLTCRLVSS